MQDLPRAHITTVQTHAVVCVFFHVAEEEPATRSQGSPPPWSVVAHLGLATHSLCLAQVVETKHCPRLKAAALKLRLRSHGVRVQP